ncbi:MAG: NAD-dependent epimerase/dehydratase family protein [Gemmatimonadaceae bacterium]|nr:NAD-dependent epimerase/dehydratase family protein [Gemmatimonadaceae bacterium]MCW5825459.1 NAD-dependent epimerase/dehydratase family protein [Gemmatimonadaceae bacterium]
MTTKRALVTGGAGFIGSHVADALLADGWQVTVLDDLSSGKRTQVPAGAEFVQADIRSAEASTLVRSGRFDLLCHLAAQMDVRRSVADPGFDADVNVRGSLNLLEAVRASGLPTRVLFASTGGAVYGDFVQPPNLETFEKNPESPYGIAKFAVELYLAYYARVHGLDYVALRFANVFGPRQDPHGEAGVVAIFCQRLLAGQPLTVFGDGGQTRDYVFVGDVARAHVLAARRAALPSGRVDERGINLGTGRETSVLELAQALMRAARREVPLQHAPPRAGEQRRSVVSIAKAASVLGWAPEIGLEDGLARTFAWFATQ